jgi:glycosyltransferase involved in cell wall biosynthesis
MALSGGEPLIEGRRKQLTARRDPGRPGVPSPTPLGSSAKLLFLAPGDVGKGRVEPISWMQTCRAYAARGFDVVLVTLKVRRPDAVPGQEIWQHYGLEPTFRIIVMPTLLGRSAPTWWFRLWAGLAASSFALRTAALQLIRPRRVVVHARLPILAAPFVLLQRMLPRSRRPLLVLETHSLPKPEHAWVLRRADLVVTNSETLASDVQARLGIPKERVLHAPLGPHNSVQRRPKNEARLELGLPETPVIAAYVGKLTEGISDFLVRAAAHAADAAPQFRLLIVGGNPEILSSTRGRIRDLGLTDVVILAGFVAPAQVELYQAAADVLLFHVPSSFLTFPYCTPSKGYEYQAAGRPIVATDIPLFEEVFGRDRERAIRVVEPTPEAFAEGVLEALTLEDGGREMAERAAAWVRGRTWEARVDAVLGALGI